MHPAWVTVQFERLAYGSALPPIRLHDLRHSSEQITGDIYTSILPEVAREAAETIAGAIPHHAAAGAASRDIRGMGGLPSGSPPQM